MEQAPKVEIAPITDTTGLLALAKDAEGRNRSVDMNKLLPHLDPEGVHVCMFKFLHNDVEWRSHWLVKVDENTPGATKQGDELWGVDIWLDVSFKVWDQFVRSHRYERRK